MEYSYYVNTFADMSDGSIIPIIKAGIFSTPDNICEETDIIEYMLNDGIISRKGYEFLELTKI